MPENEGKSFLHLFHGNMICSYEVSEACGSGVEPSPQNFLGSMFDVEAIHAQFPSNIEPNYQPVLKVVRYGNTLLALPDEMTVARVERVVAKY